MKWPSPSRSGGKLWLAGWLWSCAGTTSFSTCLHAHVKALLGRLLVPVFGLLELPQNVVAHNSVRLQEMAHEACAVVGGTGDWREVQYHHLERRGDHKRRDEVRARAQQEVELAHLVVTRYWSKQP